MASSSAWLDTLHYMAQNFIEDGEGRSLGKTLLLHLPESAVAAIDDIREVHALALFHGDNSATALQCDETPNSYDTVFIRAVQNTDEMLGSVARGYAALRDDGGNLFIAQNNDTGAKSLEKHLKAAFGAIPVLSKNKGRGFRIIKNTSAPTDMALLAEWTKNASPRMVRETGYISQPGIFGWDKIDAGSRFLLENLPPLKGRAADFGCGYGYLACEALAAHPALVHMTAIDHDLRAVSAAILNMEERSLSNIDPARAAAVWGDLSRPYASPQGPFDAIVMNPPFHSGKQTDLGLGASFIKNAFENLKRGASLYMVANQTLPYEHSLQEVFGNYAMMAQSKGFKILRADKTHNKTNK